MVHENFNILRLFVSGVIGCSDRISELCSLPERTKQNGQRIQITQLKQCSLFHFRFTDSLVQHSAT